MSHFNKPTAGATVFNTDITQFCDYLEVPSGGTETGLYVLAGGSGASGWTVSNWIKTNNRWSTPLSVSLNTSILSPTGGANSPSVAYIDSSGFEAYFITSAASTNARCGGSYTASY